MLNLFVTPSLRGTVPVGTAVAVADTAAVGTAAAACTAVVVEGTAAGSTAVAVDLAGWRYRPSGRC